MDFLPTLLSVVLAATVVSSIWSAAAEWGGWAIGIISTIVLLVFAARRELDDRIDERTKLAIADPSGPVACILKTLTEIRENVAANGQAQVDFNQRISDLMAVADKTHDDLGRRIELLEGVERRRGERRAGTTR